MVLAQGEGVCAWPGLSWLLPLPPDQLLPQFPPACSVDEPGPLAMLGLPRPWHVCLSRSLGPPRHCPSLCHQLRGLAAALPARDQLTSNPGGSWEPRVLPVSPPCPLTPGREPGGVPARLLCSGLWGLLHVLHRFSFHCLRCCASAWPPCTSQGALVVPPHTRGSTRWCFCVGPT